MLVRVGHLPFTPLETLMLAVTHTYALDVNFLTFIIAVGIPILTALITKSSASSGLKSIVTVTLAVIATGVQRALAANGVINARTWLTTLLVTWIIAIAIYYGLLKPTGTTQAVADSAPTFGLGKAA